MEFPANAPKNTIEKPPLGLKPKRIAQELRINDIDKAIERYIGASYPIPIEWIEERNELLEAWKKGS